MASDSIQSSSGFPSGLIQHASAHFPWDIVVLALLTVGLGFCLYRVLGRRVGAQGVRQEQSGMRRLPESGPQSVGAEGPDSARNEPQKRLQPPPLPPRSATGAIMPVTEREIPAPGTRVGGILADIAARAPEFTPAKFLDDVETAFGRIVPAFAAGDRDAFSGLLTPETEETFIAAITARSEAGETQRSDLRAIERLSILNAFIQSAEGGPETAGIEVSIVSRQVNILTDRNGEPLLGTDAVTEFHDLWLFERILGSASASWKLAASRTA